MSAERLAVVERVLGYTFRDPALVDRAFTRDESKTRALEWLGDRLICGFLGEFMFESVPDERFREYVIKFSELTSNRMLRVVGTEIGLATPETGLTPNSNAVADLLECLFGAVWLDSYNTHIRDIARRIFFERFFPQAPLPASPPSAIRLRTLGRKLHYRELGKCLYRRVDLPTIEVLAMLGVQFGDAQVISPLEFATAWLNNGDEAVERIMHNGFSLLMRQREIDPKLLWFKPPLPEKRPPPPQPKPPMPPMPLEPQKKRKPRHNPDKGWKWRGAANAPWNRD